MIHWKRRWRRCMSRIKSSDLMTVIHTIDAGTKGCLKEMTFDELSNLLTEVYWMLAQLVQKAKEDETQTD